MRRRFSSIFLTSVMAGALALLAGCGGGSSTPKTSGPGIPATVNLTVNGTSATTSSLLRGQTLAFGASVSDANGTALSGQTTTFQSNSPATLSVANSGLACGGTWDSLTNPVVCTPGGSGVVQVTAVSGSLKSAPITVYVHDAIDRITVSPANPSCVSSGGTTKFTAAAFSAGKDITQFVGPFNWGSSRSTVAAVDTSGVVTAAAPGQTNILASISGNALATSVPAVFQTCAVASISLHTDQNATSFNMDNTGSQTLVADAVDVNGVAVPNASTFLTFAPLVQAIGTVSSGSFTPTSPGVTPIVASCTPPTCNAGLTPVYSNLVLATVNGSATTTVYAASTSGTTMVPIDTSTNAPGANISLPQTPNSMVINSAGTRAYLGSSSVLMAVDLASGTVTQLSVAGKVIGISPDAARVAVANSSTGALLIIDGSTGATETFFGPGSTRADFAIDNYRGFITGGTTLYSYSTVAAFSTDRTLTDAANDVAFLPSGVAAFVAGGAPASVIGKLTCNNGVAAVVKVPATPSRIAALPNGTAVLAVDNTGIDAIPVSVKPGATPCPPAVSAGTAAFTSFGAGSFTPRQLIVSPDSSKAFVLSDLAKLLVYNVGSASVSSISLAGGANALSGGITPDGAQVYVGGSDGKVHRIDVASGTDAQQISVGFTPDLVAVRP